MDAARTGVQRTHLDNVQRLSFTGVPHPALVRFRIVLQPTWRSAVLEKQLQQSLSEAAVLQLQLQPGLHRSVVLRHDSVSNNEQHVSSVCYILSGIVE